MKIVALIFALSGIVAGFVGVGRETTWTVAVTGDLHGYLSPCGCSSPMVGGIKRRATAIKSLGQNVILLDNGGFVKELDKQSQFKAETAAEAIAASGVAAINLAARDAELGRGTLTNLSLLADGKLISTHLPADNVFELPRWVAKGPFLIGGVTANYPALGIALGTTVANLHDAVQDLVSEAGLTGKRPVLMVSGTEEKAKEIAKEFTDLALVVYSSTGDPQPKAIAIDKTTLVSPGDRGRNLVSIGYDGKFDSYRVTKLNPEIEDSKEVSEIFASYLERVDSANLIDQWIRIQTPSYSGNAKCGSCHGAADKIWKDSKHHHALETLEKVGQARDPDCLVCHVVGLSSSEGFRTRAKTPDLTDVGCESCHGPGEEHSVQPLLKKMAKVGEKSCAPCHTAENSPNFDFKTYWAKIKH